MSKRLMARSRMALIGAATAAALIGATGVGPAVANGGAHVNCSYSITAWGASQAVSGGSGSAWTDPEGWGAACGAMKVRVIYTNTLGGTRYYGTWKSNNSSGLRVTATTAKYIVGGTHNVTSTSYPANWPFTT